MMPVALYRIFDSEGALLYIGQSANPLARLESHVSDKDWANDIHTVSVEWVKDRRAAIKAEAIAIRAECPEWNKQLSPMRQTAARTLGEFPAPHNANAAWGCSLTAAQACLLGILEDHSPETVSKPQVLEKMYAHRPSYDVPEPKVVDVMVCKIRAKLPATHAVIHTTHGAGYSLEDRRPTSTAQGATV